MRPNLIIFGIGLLVVALATGGFALLVLNMLGITVEGDSPHAEMIIVGVFGLLNSALGGYIGYSLGVQQSLTGPSAPAPTVTEETHLRIVEKVLERRAA